MIIKKKISQPFENLDLWRKPCNGELIIAFTHEGLSHTNTSVQGGPAPVWRPLKPMQNPQGDRVTPHRCSCDIRVWGTDPRLLKSISILTLTAIVAGWDPQGNCNTFVLNRRNGSNPKLQMWTYTILQIWRKALSHRLWIQTPGAW